MTDQHTTAVEGRRRADDPSAIRTINLPDAGRPSPIEDAFQFTNDRLDRLEHVLNSLEQTAHRLGVRLEPIFTDGSYGRPEAGSEVDPALPTPEDRRSTIARRVSGNGVRADRLGDHVTVIERLLEDLIDALEV